MGKRIKYIKWIYFAFLLLFGVLGDASAANDPLTVINNLSDLIFSIIKVVGALLTGFGIIQFGLSFKTQDPSQRANSVLTIVGGLIIAFSKEILNKIM